MKTYNEAINDLVNYYNDANDTEIYSYEERMDMTHFAKERMNDVAKRYGKTYREVLIDVRAAA